MIGVMLVTSFCGVDDANRAEGEVEDDDMQVDETDKDVVVDVSSK
jgi:hypothetical protein